MSLAIKMQFGFEHSREQNFLSPDAMRWIFPFLREILNRAKWCSSQEFQERFTIRLLEQGGFQIPMITTPSPDMPHDIQNLKNMQILLNAHFRDFQVPESKALPIRFYVSLNSAHGIEAGRALTIAITPNTQARYIQRYIERDYAFNTRDFQKTIERVSKLITSNATFVSPQERVLGASAAQAAPPQPRKTETLPCREAEETLLDFSGELIFDPLRSCSPLFLASPALTSPPLTLEELTLPPAKDSSRP